MRGVSAYALIRTQVELAREEQQREDKDEEQPNPLSTHVLNKTKLRQERLSGQAIRRDPRGKSNPSGCRRG